MIPETNELLSLNADESRRILSVIERDFQIRQKEMQRIQNLRKIIDEEIESRDSILSHVDLNDGICRRCFKNFRIFTNRRRVCCWCRNSICSQCSTVDPQRKTVECRTCSKIKQLESLTFDWFYAQSSRKFKRCGSAKAVRILKKRHDDNEPVSASPLRFVVRDRKIQSELDDFSQRLLSLAENLRSNIAERRFSTESQTRRVSKIHREIFSSEIHRVRSALSVLVRLSNKTGRSSFEADLQKVLIEKSEESLGLKFENLEIESAEDFDRKLGEAIFENIFQIEQRRNRPIFEIIRVSTGDQNGLETNSSEEETNFSTWL